MVRLEHWLRHRRIHVGVAIYVLAVGVRFVHLIDARRHNPLYQCLTTDERLHHETAVAMADGTAPRTPYLRAPGHLYFLSAIYRVSGPNPLVARAVQVVVVGVAPVLGFLIGGHLFGPLVGLISGVLSAVFWTFIFYSTELLDVSLACVLYLILAYLLVALDDARWWKWVACGLTMGLGAIVRPNILAFAPVLAFLTVWIARKETRFTIGPSAPWAWLTAGLIRVVLLAGSCLALIVPVTIRNLMVGGEPVFIGSWGSAVFWATNNPQTDGKRMYPPDADLDDSPLLAELRKDPWFRGDSHAQLMYVYAADQLGHRPGYSEVSRFYARLSLAYVRHYPWKFLADAFKRLCFTFNTYELPFNKDIYQFIEHTPFLRSLSWVHFGGICRFGVAGVLLACFRRTWPRGMNYHIAMLLTFVLTGTLFPVISRYRIPIVYLLMPFVAYGAIELVRLLSPPIRWRWVVQPLGVVTVMMVFCNSNVFGLRPAHCEYLLFHFMGACIATENHALATETADKIERALQDPVAAENMPPDGLRPLFEYFHDRGDMRRAAFFGWEMLRRAKRLEPRILDALVKVFIRLHRREEAHRTLTVLQELTHGRVDFHVAQAQYRFGRAYGDREWLVKAIAQFSELARVNPGEKKYENALAASRRALDQLGNLRLPGRPTTSAAP